jgi:hypothetical protein
VNIQSDVIHRFHGGASLVSLNQRPLSSAFLHQALLLTYAFKLTRPTKIRRILCTTKPQRESQRE